MAESQHPEWVGGFVPGRIVLVTFLAGPKGKLTRPGIIVSVPQEANPETGETGPQPPYPCNVQVFTDGTNDFDTINADTIGTVWMRLVTHDPSGMTPGTWRWMR